MHPNCLSWNVCTVIYISYWLKLLCLATLVYSRIGFDSSLGLFVFLASEIGRIHYADGIDQDISDMKNVKASRIFHETYMKDEILIQVFLYCRTNLTWNFQIIRDFLFSTIFSIPKTKLINICRKCPWTGSLIVMRFRMTCGYILHLAKLNLRTTTYDVVLYFKTDTNRLNKYSPPSRLPIGRYMRMVREN